MSSRDGKRSRISLLRETNEGKSRSVRDDMPFCQTCLIHHPDSTPHPGRNGRTYESCKDPCKL